MNELDELTAWAEALLHKLNTRQRRVLMRAVVTELRRRQAAQIAQQAFACCYLRHELHGQG